MAEGAVTACIQLLWVHARRIHFLVPLPFPKSQVDDGKLLGMASMRDVVHIMLKEHREEVERLQEYIQGTI